MFERAVSASNLNIEIRMGAARKIELFMFDFAPHLDLSVKDRSSMYKYLCGALSHPMSNRFR
jgi:hypothetical protein